MALNIKTKVKKYYNGILSKGKYSWLDVKQQIASQWFTHWSIIPKVYYKQKLPIYVWNEFRLRVLKLGENAELFAYRMVQCTGIWVL